MALLMRARIFRCFTKYRFGAVRNILTGQLRVTIAYRPRNFIVQHAPQAPKDTNTLLFCTAAKLKDETNLDRYLRRLDQDVKRVGRISRQELEEILIELRQSDAATSTQSLLIIRCCGNLVPEEMPEVRTKLVQDIWKTLSSLGVQMDISHYNALLRVYLENEHNFSPTEFLAELEHKGIEPNRVTFQRLIARYCQDGDIEGATHILEFMRSKQLPVNESVFNALIMGHSQANDTESAVGMLNVMQQAGLQPSAETYTTLLCCYANHGNINGIRSLIESCKEQDVYLMDRNYLDVIYALCTSGNEQHVDEIIGHLHKMAGYNQEAISVILRLINKGHIEVAKKIYYTMPRLEQNANMTSGNFFIQQLVKANTPSEDIISVCKEFEDSQLNVQALNIALQACMMEGNVDMSYALLSNMKARGLPIRPHYFWPIMSVLKKEDYCGVLGVLQRMSKDYNIRLGGPTIREYVVPYLYNLNPNEVTQGPWVVSQLQSVGVSTGVAASALVCHLLNLNKIQEAFKMAKRYRAVYAPSYLRKPLVQAYANTCDEHTFVGLLKKIYNSISYMNVQTGSSHSSSDDDAMVDRTEIVGQFLMDIVRSGFQDKQSLLLGALKELVQQKLPLTNSAAEHLREALNGNESSEISKLLETLTSGEFINLEHGASEPVSVARLRREIVHLEAQQQQTGPLKLQLLVSHCRRRDVGKVNQIRKELEAESVPLGPGVAAQVIDLFTRQGQLDNAVSVLNNMLPDFQLDEGKTLKLASLMVKNSRVEDAIALLKQRAPSTKSEDTSYSQSYSCKEILITLAERGEVAAVEQMFDVLISSNYTDVSNIMLGPLIKVHIVRNDLDAALRKFEECCNKYRCTPWKNELACLLIQAGDAAALQKLTDLSTFIHGEVNSLYDLVFSFVECGRLRQAKKILETPGLPSRPVRVNAMCQRYSLEGKVDFLDGLLKASKDLNHIDRLSICQHLLDSYRKNNDHEKALKLWIQMQEDDIQPSDEFLAILGNFVTQSGGSVPFSIPSPPVEETTQQKENMPLPKKFSFDVKKDNLPEAIETYLSMSCSEKKEILLSDYSTFLNKLLTLNLEESVQNIVTDMLKMELYPSQRVMNYIMAHFSNAGNIDFISSLEKYLPDQYRTEVFFNKKLLGAYVARGKPSEYLDLVEKEIDETKEGISLLVNRLPHGSSIDLLQSNPELIPQFVRMAKKYAEHGIPSPVNTLWVHYLLDSKFEMADQIWDEHLLNAPRLLFKRILTEAVSRPDYKLAKYLVDKLKTNSLLNPRAVAVAYNCALDVLINTGKTSEATQLLEEAMNTIGVNIISQTCISKLQEALKQEGKELKLPQQVQKSSASEQTSTKMTDT